jgi:hypothetical protein
MFSVSGVSAAFSEEEIVFFVFLLCGSKFAAQLTDINCKVRIK